MTAAPRFDAVVLAGGRSTRMAGQDKTRLTVADRALLDRVLDAVGAAGRVVVVGARRATGREVVWTREEPSGGGPAAALAAGLQQVDAPVTVVLAGDLPFLTARTVADLVAAVGDGGAVVVDDAGRAQWLCSAWPTEALRSLSLGPGAALRATVGTLPYVVVAAADAGAPPWFDCDTPDDVRQARELA